MGRPQKKLTANELRSAVARYKKGEGLAAIADALEYSLPVIRRVLIEAKVKIRGRGRPVTAE